MIVCYVGIDLEPNLVPVVYSNLTYRDEVIHYFHRCFFIMCRYSDHFCSVFNVDLHFFLDCGALLREAERILFNLLTSKETNYYRAERQRLEKGRNHPRISTTEDIDKRYESTLEVIIIMIVAFKNGTLADSLFFYS